MLATILLAAWLASAGPTLTVHVEGVHSAAGTVYCTLHDRAETFPAGGEKALARAHGPAVAGRVELRFEGVAAGDYAVSCYHDENDNGRLDTNFLHIPKEGVATSNDPASRMGPPLFTDARFHYAGGEQVLTVHMRY